MLKITYAVPATFSLKKYKDAHLCARTYEYPMISTIRGAILGSIIERKGREKAEELFHKVKNAQIFVQYPKRFHINQQITKRRTNKSYLNENKKDFINYSGFFTVGVREVAVLDKITFYIDESIEDIEEILGNIRRIGDSESLVFLENIEKVDCMENVLVEWNESMGYDVNLYELYDWKTTIDKNTKESDFYNYYMYSDKIKSEYTRRNCFVKDKINL